MNICKAVLFAPAQQLYDLYLVDVLDAAAVVLRFYAGSGESLWILLGPTRHALDVLPRVGAASEEVHWPADQGISTAPLRAGPSL